MGTFKGDRSRARHAGGRGNIGGPLRPMFNDADRGFRDKPDYKTAALCKQVRRMVSLALTGDCGDPVLQSLVVDDVLPAPHAGRLLVRVMLRSAPGGPGVIDVLERLARVEGLLRARVGEGLVRKRTPELTFDVIPLFPYGAESAVPHD